MKETIQDGDLLFVYDSSTETASLAITSGTDIEKIKIEFDVLSYDVETYERLAASFMAIANKLESAYDVVEGIADDEDDEE